jgi:hypothetical protein
MINLYRGICKPGLKLDLTTHGKMESISEFELYVRVMYIGVYIYRGYVNRKGVIVRNG